MRKTDLDAIRTDAFKEGMAKQYSADHPAMSNSGSGKVSHRCVMSDETVVVMAHSDDNYRLVLDMVFDGLGNSAKLLIIVNDAYALRDVLQEFIDYAELGGGHE